MAAEVLPFPSLSDPLLAFCAKSQDPLTRLTPKWIAGCFELDKELPDQYGWRLSGIPAIQQQVSGAKDSQELNRIFWEDQARNVEAYATMTFWRGAELLKAAIRSLNVGEVITPAVLVRALLELSATYLLNANMIEKTLGTLRFPPNAVVTSKEFEEQVLKMIWGTRLGEPDPHIKQTNVFTLIQKLAKNPKAADLLPKYEFLCEVAHPNVIGNSRYWSHVEHLNPDGSKTLNLSRSAFGEHSAQILEATLWGLGWSAGSLRNGFTLIRNALADVLGKLRGPN